MSTDMTVERAKQIAMQTERDIVAIIPTEYVSGVEQKQTGVLMSCSSDNGVAWAGRTRITLAGAPDIDPIFQTVVDGFNGREGYTAERTSTRDGEPAVNITGPYQATYLLDLWDGRTRIEIATFSPCFTLPDGVSRHGTY